MTNQINDTKNVSSSLKSVRRLGFWQAFIGVAGKPVSTLKRLEEEENAFQKGLSVLLLISGAYTLILGIFILRAHPAMTTSILPISVEDQYRYQIWYQGPLFLIATLVLAELLVLLARINRKTRSFKAVFAQVSFATTVPFALTTMIVELIIAMLLFIGILQSQEIFEWLTGKGVWFTTTYQLAGILWLVGLLITTTRLTVGVRRWPSIALGIFLSIIYGIPIGLFIR